MRQLHFFIEVVTRHHTSPVGCWKSSMNSLTEKEKIRNSLDCNSRLVGQTHTCTTHFTSLYSLYYIYITSFKQLGSRRLSSEIWTGLGNIALHGIAWLWEYFTSTTYLQSRIHTLTLTHTHTLTHSQLLLLLPSYLIRMITFSTQTQERPDQHTYHIPPKALRCIHT